MILFFSFSIIFLIIHLVLDAFSKIDLKSTNTSTMQKSKLIRLLKVLDADEFKGFPKFINSPFFNSNKQYLPLYRYLTKYYPDFDSPKLTKELAFKKCFPNKKYSYNTMSNLMSGLANLTEEYLLNIQFQKTRYDKKKTLVKALGERKDCYDLYEKYNTTLVQEVKSRTINDMAYHQNLRELNHDFYFHPTTNRQAIGSQGVQGIMDDLDIFYAQIKLLYLLEMKSRAYLLNEAYEFTIEEKNIQEKETYFEQACLICLIYLKLLKLYELVEDKKKFEEAKNLFSENIERISETERTNFLLHLLNYSIRRMNKGNVEYIKETLELYKLGLAFHLLIEENRIAEMTFSNIVSTGIKYKEFIWVKNFILDYKHLLDEEEKEDATLLSLAFLSFAQEKYSLTIDLLINHPFDKPFQITNAKSLLIRTYFEQFLLDDSYFELLIAQTYAFEKYVRRHKEISKEKSNRRLNFIQFTRRLATGILEKDIPDGLIDTIKLSSFSNKQWLLQKIELRKERLPMKKKTFPSSF